MSSYNLCTESLDERPTADNISTSLQMVLESWDLGSKTHAIVHDNASSMKAAARLLEDDVGYSVNCAAHTLQLSIKDSLRVVEEYSIVSEKVRKIVGHFKHSNVATSALEKKQEQLEVKRERLVQSCPTRWNSTFVMCETFLRNRTPVFAVLSDRTITNADMAVKQRMSELDWLVLEEMITLLKPLQAATKVFCSENKVTLSAVRPVIRSLLDNHFSSKPLDTVTVDLFKSSISSSLTTRFSMDEPTSNPRTAQPLQISEFLDPRYKDLRAESDNEARHIRKLYLNITL